MSQDNSGTGQDPGLARVGRFLEGRVTRGQTIVAPASLAPLPGDAHRPQGDDLPDWAVVAVDHAGALPGPLLKRLLAETTAVFAEEGHVVFARRPTFGLQDLRDSAAVRSLASPPAQHPSRPLVAPAMPEARPGRGGSPSEASPLPGPAAGLPRALPPSRAPLPAPSAPGRALPRKDAPSAAPSAPAPVEELSGAGPAMKPPATPDGPADGAPPSALTVALVPAPAAAPESAPAPAPGLDLATANAAPTVGVEVGQAAPSPIPGADLPAGEVTYGTPSLGGTGWGGLPARLAALLGPMAGWRVAALGQGADGTAMDLAAAALPPGAMLFNGVEDLPEGCLDAALLLPGTALGAEAARLARLLRPGGVALLVAENAGSLGRRLAAAMGRATVVAGTDATALRGAVHAAGLVPLRLEGHSLDIWRATADAPPRGLGPMDAGAALLEEAGAEAGPRHAAWLLFLARKP